MKGDDNISRVGEINMSSKGIPMKIISYRNYSDIDVEFLDENHYVKKHTCYINFKNGSIKNPFDKIVYGVGYIGIGDYPTWINKQMTKDYRAWYNMMVRCYEVKNQRFHQSYINRVVVCDEWHSFQNFAKWYDENKYSCDCTLQLDKDILYPGNKIYHPDKCLLVPQKINTLFINRPNKNGLPSGITKMKSGYRAQYNEENLGTYQTLEEAFGVYAKKKESVIKDVANSYKQIISKKVYEALYNYRVVIENDINYKI